MSLLLTFFKHYSGVSIVHYEQLNGTNVDWICDVSPGVTKRGQKNLESPFFVTVRLHFQITFCSSRCERYFKRIDVLLKDTDIFCTLTARKSS